MSISGRILVVDDELAIAETLRMILEMSGFTASSAGSGFEAMAKAEESCFDLLLTDVMMPGLNGFETALRVKALCPDCRLLFFSGYCGSPEMLLLSEALKKQGHDFEVLAKPLHPSVLLEKVKSALQIQVKSASQTKDDQAKAVRSSS